MNKKALALISGGLDSLLAAALIMKQGIEVEGINFFTGFTGVASLCPLFEKTKSKSKFDAKWVADTLAIKLHAVDVFEAFKPILKNPQHGYGANLNPCLDCKKFMINQAFLWMKKNNFDFLITGEVVGQRPMSQLKDKMLFVAKNCEDLLLRPLSAKILKPTIPEREGWVKRDLLYGMSGRDRKPQFALAKELGFDQFPQPAGGCILTDQVFSNRVKDFWKFRGNQDYTLDDILLLRVGKHLRLHENLKIIVGRDQNENEFLEKYQNQYLSMQSSSHLGPLVLLDGNPQEKDLMLAAKIVAAFGKGKKAANVSVVLKQANKAIQEFIVTPLTEINEQWYI
jgi:tRNA-uridine 2-sulfurtransferase